MLYSCFYCGPLTAAIITMPMFIAEINGPL